MAEYQVYEPDEVTVSSGQQIPAIGLLDSQPGPSHMNTDNSMNDLDGGSEDSVESCHPC